MSATPIKDGAVVNPPRKAPVGEPNDPQSERIAALQQRPQPADE